MTSAVGAHGVGKAVDGRWLVRGVDLDVAPGELVGILGPNGAGKSTLVRLLTGEWIPDEGSIHLLGDPLADLKVDEIARRRAVLPQDTVLRFAFRCIDVVLMGRFAHVGGDDQGVAEAAMVATDTLALRDRTYPTLSGGEQTRVSLARVLAQDTPVIFLDEPTANLDLRHQELVMATLRGLADAGAAVVAVLHDLNMAARFADRVALLAGGRIDTLGVTRDVLCAETVERVYEQPVLVVEHPAYGCPLILPRAAVGDG